MQGRLLVILVGDTNNYTRLERIRHSPSDNDGELYIIYTTNITLKLPYYKQHHS